MRYKRNKKLKPSCLQAQVLPPLTGSRPSSSIHKTITPPFISLLKHLNLRLRPSSDSNCIRPAPAIRKAESKGGFGFCWLAAGLRVASLQAGNSPHAAETSDSPFKW